MHTDLQNGGQIFANKLGRGHTQRNGSSLTERRKHVKIPSAFYKLLEWSEVRGVGRRRERSPVFFRVTNSAERIHQNKSAGAF